MNTTYTSKFQRDVLLDGEASQPPPLTQGRMYQWVKASELKPPTDVPLNTILTGKYNGVGIGLILLKNDFHGIGWHTILHTNGHNSPSRLGARSFILPDTWDKIEWLDEIDTSLPQGRMYVEVDAAKEFPPLYEIHETFSDFVFGWNKEYDEVVCFYNYKLKQWFNKFGGKEEMKSWLKPVPHKPAPAVSDADGLDMHFAYIDGLKALAAAKLAATPAPEVSNDKKNN